MTKLFISYRREDSDAHSGRIYDRLAAHFGKEAVFIDVDTIPFGVDFVEHLSEAVSQCDIVLAVIGEQWLDVRYKDGPRQGQRRLDDPDDFVRIEIQAALGRNIPVIPVLVGKAAMPGQEQLPNDLKKLSTRNAAEVRSGRDFHDHVERLIRGIEYLLQKRPKAGGQEELQKEHRSSTERKPGAIITNGLGMKLAWIPPGKFMMGSPDGEEGREPNEGPQHEVEISRGFYLGVYPVTQEEYEKVMEANPSYFASKFGDSARVAGMDTRQFPVEQVSWEDAAEFCWRLSEMEGKNYDLPTEAEWEYACRGGAAQYQVYHFGNSLSSRQANFNNTVGRTSKVGSYPANAFGLFDVHGNVWEWVKDCYDENYYSKSPRVDPECNSGSHRVRRGGSWCSLPDELLPKLTREPEEDEEEEEEEELTKAIGFPAVTIPEEDEEEEEEEELPDELLPKVTRELSHRVRRWFDPPRIAADLAPKLTRELSHRVRRGGSWCSGARNCRAAIRGWRVPADRDDFGFRLALVPSGS